MAGVLMKMMRMVLLVAVMAMVVCALAVQHVAAADCRNEVVALESGCAGVILAGGVPSQGGACCQAVRGITADKVACVCASVPNSAAINFKDAISKISSGCGLPSSVFGSCHFN